MIEHLTIAPCHARQDSGDFRLADFKVFLPIGSGVRALVDGDVSFLPYLIQELGTVDVVVPESKREAWHHWAESYHFDNLGPRF